MQSFQDAAYFVVILKAKNNIATRALVLNGPLSLA